MKKQRLFYLDLIRAVALVCILVIHFNAAVTGYFTLPSKLFGSVLPFNIYLGDFGSSLFFMVSGAGKTAAFGLPTLDKIDTSRNLVQALVIAPTRVHWLLLNGKIPIN